MKQMMKLFLLLFALMLPAVTLCAQEADALPLSVNSGPQGSFHVQGVAYDRQRQCMYMSFTTSLIKFDLQGHVLGSVRGLTGHLGCIALNPDDGRLYGSLEYKHDAIGQNIMAGTQTVNDVQNAFYVAVFDVDRIDRVGMDAAEVMTTVCLPTVGEDFQAKVQNNGREVEHRYGCSGIDGLTIAPRWGRRGGPMMLYVAYGVYGDVERTDNDYQVLLCYDISQWGKYERTLSADNLHRSGPKNPAQRYFVRTGNTEWGIQNLTYDPASGHIFAACYPGKKPGWANYQLFVIDGTIMPQRQVLQGVAPKTKGWVLSLRPCGEHDVNNEVWGWHFPYGSTGLCAIGGSQFYISHNERMADGQEATTVKLYNWNEIHGFTLAER